MIGFSIEQIARVTGGVLDQVADPGRMVTGPVVIDSRQVGLGGLFAALPGEHADGHDFAVQAVAAGAALVTGAKSEPNFTGELVAVPDDQSAVAAITQRLRPGDVVLVKASRAAGLQTVALALTAQEATP